MATVLLGGSERAPLAGARVAAPADPGERLEVSVIIRRRARERLRARVAMLAAGDRSAGVLSREEFATQHGADPQDLSAVRSFASAAGLAVVQEDAARRTMILSGTVAQFSAALGIQLQRFTHAGGTYRGRTGPIHLPAELDGIVVAILGLDNRPQAKPHFRNRRPAGPVAAPGAPGAPGAVGARAAAGTLASFTPTELASLYTFPAGTGQGECVAIIELGGGFRPTDLDTYFAGLAVSSPTVTAVSVDHGQNAPTGDANGPDGEVMLDIEVVGAIAPQAKIAVYFAPNTDAGFLDAITTAIHDTTFKPSILSISWGGAESSWTSQAMTAMDEAFAAAASLGITVCVASGDDGSSDGVSDGGNHVDFPASSPHVLACGGTSLKATLTAIADETVWNDGANGGATGGGVSSFFPLPPWQSALKATSSDGSSKALTNRGVPDVSGDADPETGYKVRIDGTDTILGGTSAVAPLWAALIARVNQKTGTAAGFINPALYGSPSDLRATLQGTNGAFEAAGGWNACTGLGSPEGNKIAALLATKIDAGIASQSGSTAPGTVLSATGSSAPDGAAPASQIPQSRLASPFDPKAAVLYGQFVQAAYSMYHAAPNNLTPPPSPDFPPGYQLAAWIQMQDFLIGSTGPVFYGFIAQNNANSNQFVLAIRGTSNGVEWWDDANAVVKTPFKVPGCGSVGMGFARIYDTLEVVERPTGFAAAAAQSLKTEGGFSRQVSALVGRHASSLSAHAAGIAPTASVTVTGHSLGSALATLYAMENARTDQLVNPLLCTFASPLVGDATFASVFNSLAVTSWRIVNTPDLVPKVPPSGFTHVDAAQVYSSTGKVQSNVGCWHALSTYLSLLDPTLQPDPGCQPSPPPDFSQVNSRVIATSAPLTSAGEVTVNINVNTR